jgi:hypothetical protein
MPNHGGNQGGQPTKLTPTVLEAICAAVRQGCYPTVAGGRVGVAQFTMYLWNQRGKREANARSERELRGESADEPQSIYEQIPHRARSGQG